MSSLDSLIRQYPELYIFAQEGANLNMLEMMNNIAGRVPPRSAVMMLVFMLFHATCRVFTRESVCTRPKNAGSPEFWAAVRLADCCLESKLAYDGLQAYAPSESFRDTFILMSAYPVSKSELCRRIEVLTETLERRYHLIEQGYTIVDTDKLRMVDEAINNSRANFSPYAQ